MCLLIVGGVVGLFVLIICILVFLREKDDLLNWVFGGVVSGVLFGFRSEYSLFV